MIEIVAGFTFGYKSHAARLRAIRAFAKSGRFNYFVPYRDAQSKYALQAGLANWIEPGQVYVDGVIGPWRYSVRCSRPWVSIPFSYPQQLGEVRA